MALTLARLVEAAMLAEGRRYRLEPLGEQALKGFAEPVPVWRVQSSEGR